MPRRVLIVHNAYQHRGGEDAVVDGDVRLLRRAGSEVREWIVTNDGIVGIPDKLRAALSVAHNARAIAELDGIVGAFRPHIVHFHNTFPLVSPGALEAVARAGLPVVQTLHNFRMICAGALLMRDGRPCEDCVGGTRLPALVHRCYRSSLPGSASVAWMGRAFRRIVDSERRRITLVALTEFAKTRFVADGFAADQIAVRPNWTADPGAGAAVRERKILFAGRLSAEKGADLLVRIAGRIDGVVEIVGEGPEGERLRSAAPPNVVFLGRLPHDAVLDRMKAATAVAIPSRWYEGFPMVVLETMASATPLIASRLGSLGEIVEHDRSGLLVEPGDETGWIAACNRLLGAPAEARALGDEARRVYGQRYGEAAGLASLDALYERAQARAAA